ncbi:unnamed protein product [Paramecium pentaurelia]|uniref:Uncharacterized protein n=1 Tax=Paramecium pentaurelia TaxID=43138 RepID=A0A8S1TG84_9CILI|nr:unnamed protein product [Paramecium pentaurelia]
MKKLVCILLISLSLANQIQGPLSNPIINDLERTHLGKAFLKLLTLKSKAQQFDFSKLYAALDDLENSIKQRIVDEDKEYQQNEVQYFTDKEFFSGQITQYQNEIASLEIDLTDFTESRNLLQIGLNGKVDELKEVQSLTDSLQQRINKEETIFKDQQNQYTNAVQALDQALQLIGQLRDGSFIQNRNVVFLEEGLKQLQHQRIMYAPLITAFTQIMAPSFNDQEASTKVQRLIQNLRDTIVKNKNDLENSYQQIRAIDDHNLSQYNQRISNLSTIVIPTIQAEIQTRDAQIQTKQNLLRDAQSNFKTASENLDNTNNRWIERTNEHNKLLDQLITQTTLFPKIVTELEGAGVRRR